jgi:alanine dehydrogenase
MIVKVKEPLAAERARLRRGQIIFCYLHLAADRRLTEELLACGCAALAYETLREDDGRLPLLVPMSEIAGRMSIQQGAKYLERPQMGCGVLLSGAPGVPPAHVTILGGGVVGSNAARIAAGFRARVFVLDIDVRRLRWLEETMPDNVVPLYNDRHKLREQLQLADLLVGAVLVPGARAPRLIPREDLRLMKPGSVIVDVAIDQGGCAETSRPTTHSQPTYLIDDVVHYCVSNMPGAVPRTSTPALCNVTLPWVLRIAERGILRAAAELPPIRAAINCYDGELTNRAVAETFGMAYSPRFER